LEDITGSIAGLGTLRRKLDRSVGKAADRVAAAHGICSFGKTKLARLRLKRATIQLARYAARLRGRVARETVLPEVRRTLAANVDAIAADLTVLRGTLACPIDA